MKYEVTNKENPFYGHIFSGTIIVISGENRVWDNDSTGRSYPLVDCSEFSGE